MPQTITLTRSNVLLVAAVLVGGALVTGSILYMFVEAPLSLVFLITCLTPAALILVLYVGYLMHSDPAKSDYMTPMKILGMVAVSTAVLLILDVFLPPKTLRQPIQNKYKRDGQCMIYTGRFEQPVSRMVYEQTLEGGQVTVIASRIFNRVESMSDASTGHSMYIREPITEFAMVGAAVLFCIPLGLLKVKPKSDDVSHNMKMYFGLVAPSYIMSMIAGGILLQLLFNVMV